MMQIGNRKMIIFTRSWKLLLFSTSFSLRSVKNASRYPIVIRTGRVNTDLRRMKDVRRQYRIPIQKVDSEPHSRVSMLIVMIQFDWIIKSDASMGMLGNPLSVTPGL